MIAEQIAENDRRAAKHAATEVVLRVADAWPRDVLRLEADLVAVLLERRRVRKRERRAVEQLRDAHYRLRALGAARQVRRRADAGCAAIDRPIARDANHGLRSPSGASADVSLSGRSGSFAESAGSDDLGCRRDDHVRKAAAWRARIAALSGR